MPHALLWLVRKIFGLVVPVVVYFLRICAVTANLSPWNYHPTRIIKEIEALKADRKFHTAVHISATAAAVGKPLQATPAQRATVTTNAATTSANSRPTASLGGVGSVLAGQCAVPAWRACLVLIRSESLFPPLLFGRSAKLAARNTPEPSHRSRRRGRQSAVIGSCILILAAPAQ